MNGQIIKKKFIIKYKNLNKIFNKIVKIKILKLKSPTWSSN